MPDKKLLVVLLLALISYAGFSQTYVVRVIDFRDSINSKLVDNNTDNLATLLINGYLSGAVSGYKFNIGQKVLKRAPLSADQTPPPWNPNQSYFIDDRVSYKGMFFICVREAEKPVPTVSDAWRQISLLGMPISTRYYFPSLEDTLSKQDFLRALIASEPTLFDPWYKEYTYYANDVVEFNGRNYEAITDNENKLPSVNPADWQLTQQGSMIMYSLQDLSAVAVLSQLQENQKVNTAEPVMLSILVNDLQLGFNRQLGLHFYFEDVIHYLNQLKLQPLLYSSEKGHLGPSHIVSHDTRKTVLLHTLKDGLTSKKIKPGKKMIVHKTNYAEFLAELTFAEPSMRWNFFINPSGDFVLMDQAVAVGIIPIAKLKSIFPVNTPRLFTYSEALTDTLLHTTSYNKLRYDSLKPVKVVRVNPVPPPQTFFWLETYKFNIDSAELKTQEKFLHIWTSLQQAFYKKQLQPKNPARTFFPCKLGVSQSLAFYKHTYTFAPDYQLSYPDQFQVDSLEAPAWFTDCSVTYKKTATRSNPDTSYTPFEISFQFMTWNGTEHRPVTYTLRWSDVKNTLRGYSPQADEFIIDVVLAKFNFYQSEVLYGVISESMR